MALPLWSNLRMRTGIGATRVVISSSPSGASGPCGIVLVAGQGLLCFVDEVRHGCLFKMEFFDVVFSIVSDCDGEIMQFRGLD